MGEHGVVDFARQGRCAVITIDRPEARNAVNEAVAQELEAAIDRLEGDDDLVVGVLTGCPPTFCAGADLKELAAGRHAELGTERGGFAGFVRRDRAKPVIAAVDGAALAGGTEIVLACDLVIASGAARFGLPEVKRGILAGAGGVFRLPRKLSRNVAMMCALTGDPLSAERAYELGLVNELCERGTTLDTALGIAERIASNAPLAVQEARRIMIETEGVPEDDAWEISAAGSARLRATEDAREGARAFIEKRSPVWRGI